MNFYICSTPYHILLSLCHLHTDDKMGVFYLTTHDPKLADLYKVWEKELIKFERVEKVIIRKRVKFAERIFIESLKDYLFYGDIKKYLDNSVVFLFPWNPYALYTTSNFIYRKSKVVILVEEGANLYAYPKPNKLNLLIKNVFYNVSIDFYKDDKLRKILVQFPDRYPDHLTKKTEKFDLLGNMKCINGRTKELIIDVFLEKHSASELKQINSNKKLIIVTQPLSEDGFITEKEKISLYKEIIENHKDNYQIFLKKHPRERTTYRFDNVTELSGSFPSEIFLMLEMKFNKAVGICTSAILTIDADEKINIDENFLKRRKGNE